MAAIEWEFSGKSKQGYRPLNVSASATGSAQTIITAPAATHRIIIDKATFVVDTQGTLTIYNTSNETGNRLFYAPLAQYGGLLDGQLDDIALPYGTALLATVSAGNVYYVIWYHLELGQRD